MTLLPKRPKPSYPWTKELNVIFQEADLQHIFGNKLLCNVNMINNCPLNYDLRAILFDKVLQRNQERFWIRAEEKLEWIFRKEEFLVVNLI
jgi:hypothetical protein